MATTGYLFSEIGLKHDTGLRHPEHPNRLRAIKAAFDGSVLNPHLLTPTNASREDLLRVHTEEHIQQIERCCASGERYPDPDTVMMKDSYDAALLAAGAGIVACKAVLDGECDNAFSAMRPPGHHAERDKAMGFCLFNNVAVAAQWLRHVAGLERVAILDWDVHHGNGTQHIFYDDPNVYYVSLHQAPHYPGTGLAEERGAHNTNRNYPMAAGTPAEVWMDTFRSSAIPEIEAFNPEFLLISCGFDAHKSDPLSDQHLEAHHYAEMTTLAKKLAGGKVVSLLEGGYNLDALGESSVAHFQALRD